MEISNKPVALKTRCGFYTSSLAMSAKNNKRNSSYNDKSIVKIDGAVYVTFSPNISCLLEFLLLQQRTGVYGVQDIQRVEESMGFHIRL